MAKLKGVKVIDMKDGEVTKVLYNGAEYVKVNGEAKEDDIVLTYDGEHYRKVTDRKAREGDYVVFTDIDVDYLTEGKPYEIIGIDFIGYPRINDNDGDGYVTLGDDFEIYEKVSEATEPTETLYALITTMDGQVFREPISDIDDVESLVELIDEGITIYLTKNDVYIPPHNIATIKPQTITE